MLQSKSIFKNFTDRIFYTFILSMVLLKLWLHSHLEIIAIPSSTDDFLYVKLAYFIKSGKWLGAYDQYTLIKNSFYSVFLAFISKLKLPLLFSIQLLYSLSGIYLIYFLKKHIKLNNTICAALFMIYIFNPMFASGDNLRTLRDPVYACFVLLFIIGMFYVILSDLKLIYRIIHVFVAGISAAFAYYTKEEGIWILGLMALCFTIVLAKYYALQRKQLLTMSVIFLSVFAVMQLVLLQFKNANYKYYKLKILSESTDGHNEKKAITLLNSVNPTGKIKNVMVMKKTRFELYKKIPSFRELEAYEASIFQGWSEARMGNPGCPQPLGPICEETTHFTWALRNAMSALGYYQSAKTADEYYGRLANELETACKSGNLYCKQPSGIYKFVPVLGVDELQLPNLLSNYFKGFWQFVTLKGFDVDKSEVGEFSYGNEETFLITQSITNNKLKIENSASNQRLIIHIKNSFFALSHFVYSILLPIMFVISFVMFFLNVLAKNKSYEDTTLLWVYFFVAGAILSRHLMLTVMSIVGHLYFRVQYFTPSYTLLIMTCMLGVAMALKVIRRTT